MNSNGDLYATRTIVEALDEKLREDVQVITEGTEVHGISVSPEYLKMLAPLPRRSRRVFYSERRRGRSESEALSTAQAAVLLYE